MRDKREVARRGCEASPSDSASTCGLSLCLGLRGFPYRLTIFYITTIWEHLQHLKRAGSVVALNNLSC